MVFKIVKCLTEQDKLKEIKRQKQEKIKRLEMEENEKLKRKYEDDEDEWYKANGTTKEEAVKEFAKYSKMALENKK